MPADTSRVPACDKATDVTVWVCPSSEKRRSWVAMSTTWMALSRPPKMRCVASSEKSMQVMGYPSSIASIG